MSAQSVMILLVSTWPRPSVYLAPPQCLLGPALVSVVATFPFPCCVLPGMHHMTTGTYLKSSEIVEKQKKVNE